MPGQLERKLCFVDQSFLSFSSESIFFFALNVISHLRFSWLCIIVYMAFNLLTGTPNDEKCPAGTLLKSLSRTGLESLTGFLCENAAAPVDVGVMLV